MRTPSLESFGFTIKNAPKMYPGAMVVQVILRDIVTQSLTKKGEKESRAQTSIGSLLVQRILPQIFLQEKLKAISWLNIIL